MHKIDLEVKCLLSALFFLFAGLPLLFSQEQALQATDSPKVGADSSELVYVRPTGRISSNHFSDLVLDREGNAYIASFAKKSRSDDYVSITKINTHGVVEWDVGNETLGRATAVSIDTAGRIWVVGFYYQTLKFGSKLAMGGQHQNTFVAVFDSSGNCQRMFAGIAPGAAYGVHVNNRNEVLVHGVGRTGYEPPGEYGENATAFLALFDANAQPRWATRFTGDAMRIRSDRAGNFLVAGQFNSLFDYAGNILQTENRYDNDGFLMKIRPDGGLLWLQQFGNRGAVRRGFRTQEAVQDIAVSADNWIRAIALFESPAAGDSDVSQYASQLLVINPSGQVFREIPVAVYQAAQAGVSGLACLADGTCRIFGAAGGTAALCGREYQFAGQQSYLLHMDSSFDCRGLLLPEHDPGMAIRAGYSNGFTFGFAGHFQGRLRVGKDSIENAGEHGVFLVRFPAAP